MYTATRAVLVWITKLMMKLLTVSSAKNQGLTWRTELSQPSTSQDKSKPPTKGSTIKWIIKPTHSSSYTKCKNVSAI